MRKIETGAVVKSHRGLSGIERGKGICYQWKEKGQCSEGDQCISGMRVTIVQDRHRKPRHPLRHQLQKREVEVRRGKRTLEAGVHLGSSIDSRAKTS